MTGESPEWVTREKVFEHLELPNSMQYKMFQYLSYNQ